MAEHPSAVRSCRGALFPTRPNGVGPFAEDHAYGAPIAGRQLGGLSHAHHAETGGSPIFITPLAQNSNAESKWIQVTEGSGVDTTPWWSPDGAILYFLSKRDGSVCIWAQHLEPRTKQLVGAAFAVAHFHGARLKAEIGGLRAGRFKQITGVHAGEQYREHLVGTPGNPEVN